MFCGHLSQDINSHLCAVSNRSFDLLPTLFYYNYRPCLSSSTLSFPCCFSPAPPTRLHLSSSSPPNLNISCFRSGTNTLPSVLPHSLPTSLVASAPQSSFPRALSRRRGPPVFRITTLFPLSGGGMRLLIVVSEPTTGTPPTWRLATLSFGTPRKHVGTALSKSCSVPGRGSQ